MNAAAAKKLQLVFAAMFNQRMKPLYQKVEGHLEEGTIGDISPVELDDHQLVENPEILRFQRPESYRAGRRRRTGQPGPHQLDLLAGCADAREYGKAHSEIRLPPDITVEDDVNAYFEYATEPAAPSSPSAPTTPWHGPPGNHGDNGKIIITDSKTAPWIATSPRKC